MPERKIERRQSEKERERKIEGEREKEKISPLIPSKNE